VPRLRCHKKQRLALVGDARVGIAALGARLRGYAVDASYATGRPLNKDWGSRGRPPVSPGHGPLPAQSESSGAVNDARRPTRCRRVRRRLDAGDLHKLWRTRDPKQYHVEYGYSCMGYEISRRARREDGAPEREVFSMVAMDRIS